MPVAVTPITALPTPPSRADSVNFAARGDALLGALPGFVTQTNALASGVVVNATEVASNALAATQARTVCESVATSAAVLGAAAAAATASAASTAAQGFAAVAQAVSPDSPVRMNSRSISAALTIPSAYNAASVGPIAIAEGISATVSDNATWSIQ